MSERRQPPLYLGFPRRDRILRRFWTYHREHPKVYQLLRVYALDAAAAFAPTGRIGIGLLFERLRWYVRVETRRQQERRREEGDWKLNNDFRSLMAREVMAADASLAGLFETRAMTAA